MISLRSLVIMYQQHLPEKRLIAKRFFTSVYINCLPRNGYLTYALYYSNIQLKNLLAKTPETITAPPAVDRGAGRSAFSAGNNPGKRSRFGVISPRCQLTRVPLMSTTVHTCSTSQLLFFHPQRIRDRRQPPRFIPSLKTEIDRMIDKTMLNMTWLYIS